MQIRTGHRQRPVFFKTWIKTAREDLQDLEIINNIWKDRVTWRARICVADPDNFGNELDDDDKLLGIVTNICFGIF